MTSRDLLSAFSELDRQVVLELLQRIVNDPEHNLNAVSFLRHGDGTHLNTESPKGGPGGNGLTGSAVILQFLGPLMDPSTRSHSSFSFTENALDYIRDRIDPPDHVIRATVGRKIYDGYLSGEWNFVWISTRGIADQLGVEPTKVGFQIRALIGARIVDPSGQYYPDQDQIGLKLTSRGQDWAIGGFPDAILASDVRVSVAVHVDVVATIRSVRDDSTVDPELRLQWEALMKELEESLEQTSDEPPIKAAIEMLDTASRTAGLFAKSVEFVHRHLDDILRISSHLADNIPKP